MLKRIRDLLVKLHRDDRGAMSAEMVLIIALIAVPIIIILAIFRGKIIGWFTTKSSELDQYNQ